MPEKSTFLRRRAAQLGKTASDLRTQVRETAQQASALYRARQTLGRWLLGQERQPITRLQRRQWKIQRFWTALMAVLLSVSAVGWWPHWVASAACVVAAIGAAGACLICWNFASTPLVDDVEEAADE